MLVFDERYVAIALQIDGVHLCGIRKGRTFRFDEGSPGGNGRFQPFDSVRDEREGLFHSHAKDKSPLSLFTTRM